MSFYQVGPITPSDLEKAAQALARGLDLPHSAVDCQQWCGGIWIYCPFHNVRFFYQLSNDNNPDPPNRIGNATPAARQTISFLQLSAEIRNQIYELALPHEGEDLIIPATNFDGAMTLAIQPALTRVSRRVRSDTL